MSVSSSALRWRGVPRDAIAWRRWEGEVVVRNERTGSTHLLAPLAGRILLTLIEADAALGRTEIAACLEGDLAGRLAEEQSAAVDEVLSEFERLGLAEPA